MGTMKRGKVIEATASMAIRAAGGEPGGSGRFTRLVNQFTRLWGIGYPHIDEERAEKRRSLLFMGGERLNNGRGAVAFDATVLAPVPGGDRVIETPVSLKGGDSRDITTKITFLRPAVEAGMPLWVYLLDAREAQNVEYEDGVLLDVAPARGLTMRRINIAPLLRDYVHDWTDAGDSAHPAHLRWMTSNGSRYLRARVTWNRVPERYWLDREPVPFSPTAPLPYPW